MRRRPLPPPLVRALASTAPPSRRRGRRRSIFELVGDPALLAVVGLLVAVGLAAVYAATRDSLTLQGQSGSRYLVRDALNAGVALVAGCGVFLVGHQRLRRWAPALLGLAVIALLGVLSPLGATVGGAKAWYSFGPVQVEPSQLAVIVVIVFVAARLGHPVPAAAASSSTQQAGRRLPAAEVAFCVLAAALAAGLILAEPALGMAVVLIAVLAGLLVLAGMRAWLLAAGALLAGGAGFLAWQTGLVQPYQQHRLTAFLHPQLAGSAGYQVLQSLTAVGAGGLTGRGFLRGTQTNGGFVPEQRTDFVFTVIAEETGFVGAAVVLALLCWLCLRALRTALRAVDGYGALLSGGLCVWLAAQTFVYVAMAVGMLPVTGIPLPFISYGGSALSIDLAAAALLCSVARETAQAAGAPPLDGRR